MKYYLHLETNRWDSRGCAIERQSMRVACFQGELWTALTVRNMLDDPSLWAADRAVHHAVCERIRSWWSSLPGWRVTGLIESPITGPEGNREFLIAAARD